MSNKNGKTGSSKAAIAQSGETSLNTKPGFQDGKSLPMCLDPPRNSRTILVGRAPSMHASGSVPSADANLTRNCHRCLSRHNYNGASSQSCLCELKRAEFGANSRVSALVSGALVPGGTGSIGHLDLRKIPRRWNFTHMRPFKLALTNSGGLGRCMCCLPQPF
ncbi:uncharacterized protein MELLADRAFT_104459 [Melampsora larici-populina 98AG31]|uniref:Uncharacterized protein n=1 Tax=Melampsora larici-populina (strain 98AG31 / pathotype 3-4-7) TaxID=747676 RepID=F4RES0_MELLP|nr:uncharacterized protein MELLADRAFT_104459 [Melampsora larici-populina 98AG31]EGG09231.1 hypothetical protein MELLADRAFT_104459 [Melampsora larici-populina 98AG31]